MKAGSRADLFSRTTTLFSWTPTGRGNHPPRPAVLYSCHARNSSQV